MSDAPRLETERLILRPPLEEDFEDWAAFAADPVSAAYIGGVKTRAEAWRGMATMAGSWALRGFAMFSVIEKETGRWVGRVGPWRPEGWPGTEVGWGIARDRAGRGYATEAAAVCIDWAFDTLGWTDVVHCIHPDNAASIALATKLGSRKIGHEPDLAGVGIPADVYGQSRDDWRARQAARNR